MSVYAPSDGDAFDYLIEAHETAAYHSNEFEGGAVTLIDRLLDQRSSTA